MMEIFQKHTMKTYMLLLYQLYIWILKHLTDTIMFLIILKLHLAFSLNILYHFYIFKNFFSDSSILLLDFKNQLNIKSTSEQILAVNDLLLKMVKKQYIFPRTILYVILFKQFIMLCYLQNNLIINICMQTHTLKQSKNPFEKSFYQSSFFRTVLCVLKMQRIILKYPVSSIVSILLQYFPFVTIS